MINKRLKAGGGFCLLLAVLLLGIPLKWIFAVIAAAAVHEMGHYLAICLLSKTGTKVHFLTFSAQMELPSMGAGREVICAMAGPVAGFVLLLFSRWLPRIAVCAFFQSAWNLLPLYPLDGGRCLLCILKAILSPPKVRRIYLTVVVIVCVLLVTLAFYASFVLEMGMFPFLLLTLMLFRTKFTLQTGEFRSTIESS